MKKALIAIVVGILVVAGAYIAYKRLSRQSNTLGAQSVQVEVSPTQEASPTAGATSSPTPSEAAKIVVTVNYTDNGFEPKTVTVKVGTKVTWVNKTKETATVNSNPHPVHTDYPPLNLGNFGPGESVSLVFTTAGTFGYHNHLGPAEKGTVAVQ